MNNDIVVISSGAIGSPLSICRSIRKIMNVRTFVICIDDEPLSKILKKSRYITEVIVWNGIDNAEFLYRNVEAWYNKTGFVQKPVLFSTTDISCIYIDTFRAQYETLFLLTIPSSFIINTFSRKGIAEKVVEEYGLNVPKTIIVSNRNEVLMVKNQFLFPVIIKPVSNISNDRLDFKAEICDVEFFTTKAESLIGADKHFLCQEYIPGDDSSVWFYIFYRSDKGKFTEYIGIKTLQSPPNCGIMAMGECKSNEELINICHNFLDQINFVGIGGIEFKYYKGKYYYIEMNVRTEAIIALSDSNISLASIAYLSTSGQSTDQLMVIAPVASQIKYIDIRSTIDVRLGQQKFLKLLKEIIVCWFVSGLKINIWYRDDCKPFLSVMWRSIRALINKVSIKK